MDTKNISPGQQLIMDNLNAAEQRLQDAKACRVVVWRQYNLIKAELELIRKTDSRNPNQKQTLFLLQKAILSSDALLAKSEKAHKDVLSAEADVLRQKSPPYCYSNTCQCTD